MPTDIEDQDGDTQRRYEQLEQMLEAHVEVLMNRFDTARIIATKDSGDKTLLVTRGDGNYYAQLGSIERWYTKQKRS